ncbi:hypothetical protein [Tenacibaculum maritimum]|uniref:hypothetical protein n=1 Tax=Tenacibaculum maritimum TaxID=107401 RepID=UPI0010A43489|nr:hypothetical protein [Tenacibaculum maritimum]QCD62718.1 hypothetical protein B9C57_09355 [Tenacibaculum maritimum]
MFLRNETISNNDRINFSTLINRGVNIKIIIFDDPNDNSEYPVYLATLNGKTCHFHYRHTNDANLQYTISEVWRFLNS